MPEVTNNENITVDQNQDDAVDETTEVTDAVTGEGVTLQVISQSAGSPTDQVESNENGNDAG